MSKDERSRFASLVLRRLSGLLSGCPPTDTRPQARAKLGDLQISDLCRSCKLPPFAARHAGRACRGRRDECAVARRSTLRERLDPLGGPNEVSHDHEADDEEDRLQAVPAIFAEIKQPG